MRAIAKFAMRSPAAAAFNAALYAISALFFAPFMVVSGAVLGLAAMRSGFSRALGVALLGGVIAGGVYVVLLEEPGATILLLAAWLPTLVAAQLLRLSEQQGATLVVCIGFAAFYALFMRAYVGDVEAHWLARLTELGESVRDGGGRFLAARELEMIAALMHQATVAIVALYWISTVLLARWWQAALYNPGGFGEEFRRLLVPRAISPIAAVVAVFVLVQAIAGEVNGASGDLLLVLVVLFAFQGLAVIHHRVHELELAKGWLIGLYVLAAIVPHRIGLILALVGIADTVADIRRLRRRRKTPD